MRFKLYLSVTEVVLVSATVSSRSMAVYLGEVESWQVGSSKSPKKLVNVGPLSAVPGPIVAKRYKISSYSVKFVFFLQGEDNRG